jgi:hypothetical protein
MKVAQGLLFGVLFLVSCGKQEEPSATSKQQNAQATTEPAMKKYLRAREEELKGVVRTRFDSPSPTAAQLARRAKNNKAIRDMGLPVLESLPVVEDESTAKLRSAQEIAKRCIATTFCALKGESKDQALVDSLVRDYSAATYFSPKEEQFVGDTNPKPQDLIDFAWQYECVHVFVWALGLRDALSPPNAVCPVSDDAKLIKQVTPAEFVSKSKRRAAAEILDMADFYYRLHWAAIELRINGKKSALLDEEIIRERHRALNWLIGYFNQEWDDVSTDT